LFDILLDLDHLLIGKDDNLVAGEASVSAILCDCQEYADIPFRVELLKLPWDRRVPPLPILW
jgi:hypothetical protein